MLLEAAQFSKPIILYHGTSSKFLHSILKNGLTTALKKQEGRWVNTGDENASSHLRSLRSYGGNYLTTNFMTAYGAATNFLIKKYGSWQSAIDNNENPLIVCCQIQPQSTIPDEDTYQYGLINKNVVAPMIPYVLVGGRTKIKVDKETQGLIDENVQFLIKKFCPEFDLRQDKKELLNIAREVVLTELERRVAYTSMARPDVKSYYSHEYEMKKALDRLLYSKGGFMFERPLPQNLRVPSALKAEVRARQALNRFILKTRKVAKTNLAQEFNGYDNVRTLDDIGFSGANKIICIVENRELPTPGEKHSRSQLILHYGHELPADFEKQYKERKGSLPDLIYPNGEYVGEVKGEVVEAKNDLFGGYWIDAKGHEHSTGKLNHEDYAYYECKELGLLPKAAEFGKKNHIKNEQTQAYFYLLNQGWVRLFMPASSLQYISISFTPNDISKAAAKSLNRICGRLPYTVYLDIFAPDIKKDKEDESYTFESFKEAKSLIEKNIKNDKSETIESSLANMTLEEFVKSPMKNAYIKFKNLKSYYWKGPIIVNGKRVNVLTRANTSNSRRMNNTTINEKKKSSGQYKELDNYTKEIAKKYGFDGIQVELVQNKFLPEVLLRYGYKQLPDNGFDNPPSFFFDLRNKSEEIQSSLGEVYHATSLWNVAKILDNKQFQLSTTLGTGSDSLDKKRTFFLSLTRSKVGGYHTRSVGNYQCIMNLDVDYLKDNNVLRPVDYWGRNFRLADQNVNEMEERLFSSRQFIPLPNPMSKLIHAIHILAKPDKFAFASTPSVLRKTLIKCHLLNIPVYVYDNNKNWLAQNTPKSLKLPDLKPQLKGIEDLGSRMKPTNWFKPYLALYYTPVNNARNFDDRTKRLLSRITSEYYHRELITGLEADIHNDRSKAHVGVIARLIVKHGGIAKFIQYLSDKWKAREALTASYEEITAALKHKMPLCIVDIQPEYKGHIHFLLELTKFMNNYPGPIVAFINGDESGLSKDTKQSTLEMFIEEGLKRTVAKKMIIIDKGYGYLRGWMDQGVDDEAIIKVLKYMDSHHINDSRDIPFEKLKSIIEETKLKNIDLDDAMSLGWIEDKVLKTLAGSVVCGGGRNECLKEVLLLMKTFDVPHTVLEKFVY